MYILAVGTTGELFMSSQMLERGREFWCPLCRLKIMDPFHKVGEAKGILAAVDTKIRGVGSRGWI